MTEKIDPVEVLLELMDRAIEDAQPDGLPWPSARSALAAAEAAGMVMVRVDALKDAHHWLTGSVGLREAEMARGIIGAMIGTHEGESCEK